MAHANFRGCYHALAALAFFSLLLITLLAVIVPVLLSRFHVVRLPLEVGEILAGIIIGQSGFNLGACSAGMTSRRCAKKLDAIGYGFFAPSFFISFGANFDLGAILSSRAVLLLVPILIGAAYLVKFLPALVFLLANGWRKTFAAGVTRPLADPVLRLYDASGTLIGENDNWTSLPAGTVPSQLEPADNTEAVLVTRLAPGSYTAVLSGSGGTIGNALCELYDLEPASSSVRNISTRGQVGTGEDVMIGGFIVAGTEPTKVMIRAIGPSLTAVGVSGALPDPSLELHSSDGSIIYQNDNWRAEQAQQILDSTIPPSDERESAIIATLQPGGYTAIVRGAADTTGVALVEIYALDP